MKYTQFKTFRNINQLNEELRADSEHDWYIVAIDWVDVDTEILDDESKEMVPKTYHNPVMLMAYDVLITE